jgi:amino acid transporter
VVITVSLTPLLSINLMSVHFYSDSEVLGGTVKVVCFLGLIFVSIVITARDRIGFRYWNDPGAWINYNDIMGPKGHFLGLLSAFVNASFSFTGIETVVITAGAAMNPHYAIPKAARYITYRIGFFYVLGALLISITVDPRNSDIVSGAGNAHSSPFVIAIKSSRYISLTLNGERLYFCICVVCRELILPDRVTNDFSYDNGPSTTTGIWKG